MAVTVRDIARIAGVSVSTVSRSLNDNPRISAETREKIKGIAADLDFEFDASARSLSTRRSGTVALVCPELLDRFDNGLYLNSLIHDLRRGLAARGFDCLVTESGSPSDQGQLRRIVLQRKVDGILLLLSGTMPEDWALIRKREIPVVQVHNTPSYFDPSKLDYFFTDNRMGGHLAAGALLGAGSRQVACMTASGPNTEMAERERGWLETLEAQGVEPAARLKIDEGGGYKAAYDYVRRNMETLRRIDGIFALTDVIALGAIQGLADEGISVPRDLRVVGFDDIALAEWSRPRLTTIRQPREEVARLATDRLLALLEGQGEGLEQRMIAPSLVRRDSC
jgi:LacI family transcriptional regulator